MQIDLAFKQICRWRSSFYAFTEEEKLEENQVFKIDPLQTGKCWKVFFLVQTSMYYICYCKYDPDYDFFIIDCNSVNTNLEDTFGNYPLSVFKLDIVHNMMYVKGLLTVLRVPATFFKTSF